MSTLDVAGNSNGEIPSRGAQQLLAEKAEAAKPSLQGDIDLIVTTLQAHVTKAASYCPMHGEHNGNPCSCGWPTIGQKVDKLTLEAAKRLQHNLNRVRAKQS